MQCQGFPEFSEDGVAGGEAAEEGVVHAGAEVVLVDGVVVVLAGEEEGIGDGFFDVVGQGLAEIYITHAQRKIRNMQITLLLGPV